MSPAGQAEALIRRYFDLCNLGDREGLIACFTDDATHYFPPGLPGTPWHSAQAIADGWVWCVQTMDSRWTIEKVLCAADGSEAVIEWTHWKQATGEVLRGDEWYLFNEDISRIREIRAYYAAPADRSTAINQLSGFDYAARGYSQGPPLIPGRD